MCLLVFTCTYASQCYVRHTEKPLLLPQIDGLCRRYCAPMGKKSKKTAGRAKAKAGGSSAASAATSSAASADSAVLAIGGKSNAAGSKRLKCVRCSASLKDPAKAHQCPGCAQLYCWRCEQKRFRECLNGKGCVNPLRRCKDCTEGKTMAKLCGVPVSEREASDGDKSFTLSLADYQECVGLISKDERLSDAALPFCFCFTSQCRWDELVADEQGLLWCRPSECNACASITDGSRPSYFRKCSQCITLMHARIHMYSMRAYIVHAYERACVRTYVRTYEPPSQHNFSPYPQTPPPPLLTTAMKLQLPRLQPERPSRSKKKGHAFRFGTLNGNGQYAFDDYLYMAVVGEFDALIITEPYIDTEGPEGRLAKYQLNEALYAGYDLYITENTFIYLRRDSFGRRVILRPQPIQKGRAQTLLLKFIHPNTHAVEHLLLAGVYAYQSGTDFDQDPSPKELKDALATQIRNITSTYHNVSTIILGTQTEPPRRASKKQRQRNAKKRRRTPG